MDVVFIHGLGGNHETTWSSDSGFWPSWISSDNPTVNVYSLGYPAPMTEWTHSNFKAIPIPDRANSILDLLLSNNIGDRPLIFITHSLGGLIAKEIIRKSWERQSEINLSHNLKGVVFIGTPHTGSTLANLAGAIATLKTSWIPVGIITRFSPAVRALKKNCPELISLSESYRYFCKHHPYVKTLSFYETSTIGPTLVVDQISANAGVESEPIPADGNHFTICKPINKETTVYRNVNSLIKRTLENIGRNGFVSNTETRIQYEVSQELRQIDHYVKRLVPTGIYSRRHAKTEEFNSSIILNSLIEIGMPIDGALGTLHSIKESTAAIFKLNGRVTTQDVRKSIWGELYNRKNAQGAEWAREYAKRFGNPDQRLYVILNDSPKVQFDYTYISDNLIPEVVSKITNVPRIESTEILIPRRSLDEISREIMKSVKTLSLYEISYLTVLNLATDVFLLPPHPYASNQDTQVKTIWYDMEAITRWEDVLNLPNCDITEKTHATIELIHHSSSCILSTYGGFIGSTEFGGINTLNNIVQELMKGNTVVAWPNVSYIKLPKDLKKIKSSLSEFSGICGRITKSVHRLSNGGNLPSLELVTSLSGISKLLAYRFLKKHAKSINHPSQSPT